jgi:hypothetical protein
MVQRNHHNKSHHTKRINCRTLHQDLHNSRQAPSFTFSLNEHHPQPALLPKTKLGVDFVDDERGGKSGLYDVENARDKEEGAVADEDGGGGDGADEAYEGDVEGYPDIESGGESMVFVSGNVTVVKRGEEVFELTNGHYGKYDWDENDSEAAVPNDVTSKDLTYAFSIGVLPSRMVGSEGWKVAHQENVCSHEGACSENCPDVSLPVAR